MWDWRRKDFRSTVPAEAEAEAEVEGEASNVGGSAVGGSAVVGSAVGGSAISSGTDSFFDFRPILVCLSLLLSLLRVCCVCCVWCFEGFVFFLLSFFGETIGKGGLWGVMRTVGRMGEWIVRVENLFV